MERRHLGLTVDETDLFSPIPGTPLREDFVATVTEGATIALAVNTEKAKSEPLPRVHCKRAAIAAYLKAVLHHFTPVISPR